MKTVAAISFALVAVALSDDNCNSGGSTATDCAKIDKYAYCGNSTFPGADFNGTHDDLPGG